MEECIIIFYTTILIKQFIVQLYNRLCCTHCNLHCLLIKGIRIQSQFLFFVEKSILCVKITVSPQKMFRVSVLYIIQAFYLHSYNNVTYTH